MARVDHETVVILDSETPLSPAQFDLLRHTVNPMEECDHYGISMYIYIAVVAQF